MRVLLISANQEHFPEPIFPLGAVYVAHALLKQDTCVRIFDAGIQPFPAYALKRTVSKFRPDIFGLSLRNIDNAAYPSTRYYLPGYKKMVDTLRTLSSSPVILGGAAFSILTESLTAFLGADGGVVGEGEGIRLCEQKNKRIFCERVDIGSIAFPKNIEKIFPCFKYYRTVGIQTARGCPHRCVYCTYPLIEGSLHRKREPELIADEIAYINKMFGKENFFIVDSSFNADEQHMRKVLEAIISQKLKIRFSCYLQPKMEDISLFKLLKEAGCIAVDFGTDSGSEEMLRTLKKSFAIEDVRRVSHACRKAGIDFCHSLIFGGPKEDARSIGESVKLMDEISPKAVIAMTGIRIYPGTGIEKRARGEGFLSHGEPLLEPRFYFSEMGPSRLLKEVFLQISDRKNWFLPGEKDWSSSISTRLLRFLYRKGPLWRTFREK